MPSQRQQPRTLAEWNLMLATAATHGDERKLTRWSAMKALTSSMTKATRVGEFIAMWAVAKHELGDVTTESVGSWWEMNERTAYRRLAEFREVWGPPGLKVAYETPDPLADVLIADYRRRRQKLDGNALMGLMTRPLDLPPDAFPTAR